MEMRFRQFHAFAFIFVARHFCELSDTAFVSLKWVERPTPSIREVEDGHVEHKHGIVESPPARDYFSPFCTGI
jgi:hypothetical protein